MKKEDIIVFAEKYCKLKKNDVNGDEIIIDIELLPHQKEQLLNFQKIFIEKKYKQIDLSWDRETRETTTCSIFINWCLCYVPDFKIGIIDKNTNLSLETLYCVKSIFSTLPDDIKPKIINDNLHDIFLENGSFVKVFECDQDSMNSWNLDMVYISSLDFLFDGDKQETKELLSKIYPVVSMNGGILILSK